ncbi:MULTISPECIES: bifunctional 2-polyprenyl-6-hydroxyphenol methylase/3-demethylubiquinol 3-O-methyltransferase UbiG [unclassified Phenylobacterium]|uniref:class I SAM-dependent methyltransferase n=1 Tax=unclassified Phenylobacterium TaxID=2640670 RepID=UPI00083B93C4|nr:MULTISPECIES: class I SAM-dependent methyltransferase [unclassified Phenylobacterium]
MAKAKPYYAPGSLSAVFYDRITGADAKLLGDEDIYADLPSAGASILELGAGTGRLTTGLAKRGFQVCGVDISPVMLSQAEAAVARLEPEVRQRIELRRGDMTSLDLKRTFDLVICPFFTLAHVPTGAAWRNTFAVAARHLAPGGLAAFHLPKLELMQGLDAPDPRRPVLDQHLGDGRALLLFVLERSFKPGVNRLEQVLEYVLADETGRIAHRSAERLTYYMTDPVPPAATAGLVPDRPPIDLGGVGDIYVFRKG